MPDGTYLVTAVDEASATLRDVETAQVLTLSDPADLAVHDVVEATLSPDEPLEVTHTLETVHERRSIPVTESDEPPTRQAREIAADQDAGSVTRRERAGEGELHVLTVPPERTRDAVDDVLEDAETVARAARLGVDRVAVRSADGVVSVRYLP